MDKSYQHLLQELKQKIKQARQQAVLTVNKQMLVIYWEIGKAILSQQQKKGWGAKIIDQLAIDLKMEFPDIKGFSVRNIKYMRAFAETYPDFLIVQPVVAQLENADNQEFAFVQLLVAQIPWAHHLIIITKLKSKEERFFYLSKTVQNSWSKNILLHQIDSNLFKRQGATLNNFEITLPAPESDLARETFKNPYLLDFIGIGGEMHEREVERAMMVHLRRFMLELGKGFAYVGNQYNLVVDDNDFFLDLLFYNFHLRCFVIFELKVGDFKPEFAGKLNFYINVVNDKMKGSDDKPTIGVLLCKTPNENVVKFSLQGIHTPMGIAEYEFTKALPDELQSGLPTIQALEEELEREMVLVKSPLQEKADRLKELISKAEKEAIQREKNKEDITYLFNELLPAFQSEIEKNLSFLTPEFSRIKINKKINDWVSPYLMEIDLEGQEILKGEVNLLGLSLEMIGFKKAGTSAFDVHKDLLLLLYPFKYQVGKHQSQMLFDKLYHERWKKEEIEQFVADWCAEIIEDITEIFSRIK